MNNCTKLVSKYFLLKLTHHSLLQKILKDSSQIWKKMIDRNDKSIRITHDVYLKLYQLSMPKFNDYQCIMVDEAQDCNPGNFCIMYIKTKIFCLKLVMVFTLFTCSISCLNMYLAKLLLTNRCAFLHFCYIIIV